MSNRYCEICGGVDLNPLHRQNFIFPGTGHPVYYDVVACKQCGFTFANNVHSQSALNQFYQSAGHHLHIDCPDGLKRIHTAFFDFIKNNTNINIASSILDIGSGMGHFLHQFQEVGFNKLLGLEPSFAAQDLAKKIYGLEINTAPLDIFSTQQKFDLICLCGVLEHLSDLRSSVNKINSLLKTDGYLFIAVPDTLTFNQQIPSEPFLEFALEHINFFSSISLENLLKANGFKRVIANSQHNDFYDNDYLLAIYRKAIPDSHRYQFDAESENCLVEYIKLSQERLRPVQAAIDNLIASQEKVIIWGAGSLTSRLLCDTTLSEANVLGIVDKNTGLHGKELNGLAISSPESIREHAGCTIFIASTTYAKEIRRLLNEQYGWTGQIISIISEAEEIQ
jgi:SAM-dependent methyltransferase